ncbi:MAG: TIGR02444 family protein, partial [Alphaproteobacteria bacterium]|nr:TIGR02444 family protein [Alphaproteobacteria bacterium]
MSDPPGNAFWNFSLRAYARPGVADACIRLQDRYGVDVNVLFYL